MLFTCLFSQLTIASDATDLIWKNSLQQNKITNSEQQSYCYMDEHQKVEGQNIDLQVRLASVSKLLTSLWAIETLGLHYQYKTKLYIKNNSLHIEGSLDPFFGNEKVFFLLSQLNELGYTTFDNITFDKNLIVYPSAQTHTDNYPQITPDSVTRNLNMYFNTKSWSKNFTQEYKRIASLSDPGKFKNQVQLEAKSIQFVDKNPFENDESTRVLTYTSPELAKYLKEINVQSNNYASHTIFLNLGGENAFNNFLHDAYKLDADKIHFYSGSGLPTIIDGNRKDNYATCSVSVTLLSELKAAIEKQNMTIESIIAVPGSDGGTFRNRTFPSELKNSFVAKTGTLTHVSTLAGIMSTKSGYGFFGVFNQTPVIANAKEVQNTMVEAIMNELTGPLAFDYSSEIFHTYDRNSNVGINLALKSMNLEESAVSDFLPFEDGLK
jgi:D-alanyl-D-alanine carboxypeptidase/D-alanyl-D-alanine-endopeptidase (penicillin-binding protein 4)